MITSQISPLIKSHVLNKLFEHNANSTAANLVGSLARKQVPAAMLYIGLPSYERQISVSIFNYKRNAKISTVFLCFHS